MIVRRAFKFRLNPNRGQYEKFGQFAGARRWIYNWGLELRQKTYSETKKTLSCFEQNNQLVFLKEQPMTKWLDTVHSQVLQQALKDLDQAYQHFFRRVKQGETPGHPKFRKRGVRDTFRYPQGVKVQESKVYLPKIGWVKFRKSREIQGDIKETTIVQEGEHWYVCFSCEWEKSAPQPAPIDEERAIGIDLGIKHFAVSASGTSNIPQFISNLRIFNRLLSRLKILSRRLAKKAKGSRNRLKARLQLSKLHARIANVRKNFAQQLSTQIVKNHDIICVESLDISELLQKSARSLSRNIADAAWRYFLNCLKYKTEEFGKHLVEVGKYFPSTQICSSCLNRQKLDLTMREYHCPNCGLKIDRDLNSAISLKAAGMTVLTACGATIR